MEKESFVLGQLTIETVDETFFNGISLMVDAHVEVSNKTAIMFYDRDKDLSMPKHDFLSYYKVPVIFATGERWKLIRDSKAIRDKNGVLVLPLITIRRLDIDKTSGFYGPGGEFPFFTIAKQIAPKTNNLQNQLKSRNISSPRKNNIIYDVWSIPTPDIFTVSYEVSIWTQYQQHMNEIIEKLWSTFDAVETLRIPVNFTKDNPNGDGRYLVAYFDNLHSNISNLEDMTDQERIIRYVQNYKVPAYTVSETHDPAKSRSFGGEKGLESGNREAQQKLKINHYTTPGEIKFKVTEQSQIVNDSRDLSKIFKLS